MLDLVKMVISELRLNPSLQFCTRIFNVNSKFLRTQQGFGMCARPKVFPAGGSGVTRVIVCLDVIQIILTNHKKAVFY